MRDDDDGLPVRNQIVYNLNQIFNLLGALAQPSVHLKSADLLLDKALFNISDTLLHADRDVLNLCIRIDFQAIFFDDLLYVLRAFFMSKMPKRLAVSLPKMMFCVTVKLSTNIKCWCTIPTLCSIAVVGFLI